MSNLAEELLKLDKQIPENSSVESEKSEPKIDTRFVEQYEKDVKRYEEKSHINADDALRIEQNILQGLDKENDFIIKRSNHPEYLDKERRIILRQITKYEWTRSLFHCLAMEGIDPKAFNNVFNKIKNARKTGSTIITAADIAFYYGIRYAQNCVLCFYAMVKDDKDLQTKRSIDGIESAVQSVLDDPDINAIAGFVKKMNAIAFKEVDLLRRFHQIGHELQSAAIAD
jgi:hypothetical protein